MERIFILLWLKIAMKEKEEGKEEEREEKE